MARCDNCNKFTGLNEAEAELWDDPHVASEGTVTAEVRVVRRSDCCYEEKAEAMFSAENTLDAGECPVLGPAQEESVEMVVHAWEYAEHSEPEVTDEYRTKDRHGKPIKNPRYQARLIGFTMEVTAKCTKCGTLATVTLEDNLPASAFAQL